MKHLLVTLLVASIWTLEVAPVFAQDVVDETSTGDFGEEPAPGESSQPQYSALSEPVGAQQPSNHPMAKSIGLGFGYRLPADVQLINVTSARIVLTPSIIIEPLIEFSISKDEQSVGAVDTKNTVTSVGAGAELRYALWQRQRASLAVVGGIEFAYTKNNPTGSNNDTKTTRFSASWGAGLDLWPWRNWGLSFTLTNPLVSYTKQTQEQVVDDIENKDLFFGAIWNDSQLRIMLHAYF